ncbi:hypothetical protein HMPREF1981_01033 [Bacteroides pyogenes F0041]|uniref:Uncharacterized protein n=1 Tax=Bacteroides pyogenes F0041 TaxID=1321819 RepID=U2DX57_9BACE|nr:hypothetical protein HMPREF1981_01033 [Bacteroides pyogenes F0041]
MIFTFIIILINSTVCTFLNRLSDFAFQGALTFSLEGSTFLPQTLEGFLKNGRGFLWKPSWVLRRQIDDRAAFPLFFSFFKPFGEMRD